MEDVGEEGKVSLLTDILKHNQNFVKSREYEAYRTTKFPEKKMVVVSCMDTRLTELLPKAMNLANGDAKIVKTAGAVITHPFGSVMRSILVAIYELNAREVLIIGHHDCGMTGLKSENIIDKAKARGIKDEALVNVDVDIPLWLSGFSSVEESVQNSVDVVRNHPLLPEGIPVHGLVVDPSTGELEVLIDGYLSM